MASRKLNLKPVTLIVGIICRDGIVVAGDSQTTWGTGKRWDANKMTELEYPLGRALVAESGATITSQSIVEELQRLANNKELFDQHRLSGLVELAVREVRKKLRSQNFECTAEELQSVIERNELDASLMIAYDDGGPKIDTISLKIGIAQRAKSFFEAIGSGSDLAGYLLRDLCVPDSECTLSAAFAVHVVETVKQNDPFCGGPTRLGIHRFSDQRPAIPSLGPQSIFDAYGMYYRHPLILSDKQTDEIVKIVLDCERANRENRVSVFREMLRQKSENKVKELMESVQLNHLYPEPDVPEDDSDESRDDTEIQMPQI